MPKINPIHIYEVGPGEMRFERSYETHVLANGEFQTLVPEDHLQYFRVMKFGGAHLDSNKVGRPVLKASSVRDITEALKGYAKASMNSEKTTSLWIFFKTTNKVAYAVNPALPGRIFPNGQMATEATGEEGAYRWYGSNIGGTMGSESFSVGVAATVVEKTVHSFPDGRFAVEHSKPKLPRETFGWRLCQFNTGLRPANDFWSPTNPDEPRHKPARRNPDEGVFDSGNINFVPYTEDAAEFFYNLTCNLCALAEGMRQFFGTSKEDLLENINDPKKRLALAAPRRTPDAE